MTKTASNRILLEASAIWYIIKNIADCDLEYTLREIFGADAEYYYHSMARSKIAIDVDKSYSRDGEEYKVYKHLFNLANKIVATSPEMIALHNKCHAFFTGFGDWFPNTQIVAAMLMKGTLATRMPFFLRYNKLANTELWRDVNVLLVFQG